MDFASYFNDPVRTFTDAFSLPPVDLEADIFDPFAAPEAEPEPEPAAEPEPEPEPDPWAWDPTHEGLDADAYSDAEIAMYQMVFRDEETYNALRSAYEQGGEDAMFAKLEEVMGAEAEQEAVEAPVPDSVHQSGVALGGQLSHPVFHGSERPPEDPF